ncbi:MAG: hypothetical protein IPM85_17295 [Chitinophagaceae bacterium]|nr:hypothetical protein [Chitinophagaceae bacterium]
MKTLIRNDNRLFLAGGLIFIFCLAMAAFTGKFLIITIPFLLLVFIAGWQFREILFLALLFSLPFSAEYSFSARLGTDLPDEPLMWLTSFIVTGSVLYNPADLKRKYLLHPLSVIFFILLLWIIGDSIFSAEPETSVKFLLAKGWYVLAFFVAPTAFSAKEGGY